ncbi:hypothetical protein AB0B21_33020 [Streptomyces rimosus]|uniref:hypothetical protein n=1 Tax=Streptomyces rimosus TaxID=1927 RepID=UPI000517F305|nr:hypothetical protein [Streptomyces rimosus]
MAYWVQPVRLDADRRLHVRCLTRAWSIQMKLLGRPVTARLNAAYPELAVAGLVAATAPLRLLVLGPAHWPHHELLTASLETAWHDVTQLYGTTTSPVFVHALDCALGAQVAVWSRFAGHNAEGHAPDWGTCGPDCPAADPEHRVQRADRTAFCRTAGRRLNRQMIDLGADMILALVPADPTSARRLAADLRYAHTAQVPVWEVHEPGALPRSL